ncbi:MAG: serine hydrolase [Gammaproteobacteria bacterium]|jgi:CubicO group peptidase (beta-lactamase class C family)|nr:serine hydrolase [Gammaproteobacteria bacterium]MBT3858976.1 serine hydrolase [Gammaproteobacteria bacterium]MBT3988072.1 serine hydrolase [Gammaproteobacteria bacterium]MBT4256622.1 serine hydrolase [Gammaproteobacteria bacterium]MBT4583003.1 serine hydrolase [Gammaproteobacteria bacterium]
MQYFPNRNKLIAGLVASVLAFSSVQSLADIDQSRLDQISADIQARIDGDKLSGAVVMVAKDGEIEMNKAFGYQNVEDEIAMSTDSIFRIFSMTKPVTGTALMILHDEGKFDLDDAVEKHLPELANMQVLLTANDDGSFETEAAGHPMTVRELMSHTGGLLYTPPLSRGPVAEAYAKAGIMNLPNYTLAESIPELANIPLAYQPGSQWVYSISVDVQGYMVEVLSGQTFDEFLQDRIFEPLGMHETGFYVRNENAHRLARQYVPGRDGNLRRTDSGAFLSPPKFLSGGGGLTSTASDYMKFAQMHLNGGTLNGKRILSEDSIQLMRSNQLPDQVANIGQLYPGNVFGLDFAIVEDSSAYNGAPVGTHWWWGIAGSWFWIDPVENIVMIGMIQNDDIMYSLQVHAAMREALYN